MFFHQQKKIVSAKSCVIMMLIIFMVIVAAIIGATRYAQKFAEETVQNGSDANNNPEQNYRSFMEVVKMIAGFEGEMVYLILLQNNHELRATGGFIGQYAIVRVRNGIIQEMIIEDSGVLDARAPLPVPLPRAPIAMKTYLEQGFLFFRDANWEPNFDDAAKTIAQVYALEDGAYAEHIDGIIAIDTRVLEALVKMVGPITIDEQTYTHENVVDALEYEVEVAYKEKDIVKKERKVPLKKMGTAILERAKSLNPLSIPSAMGTLSTLADEKHMVMFSFDRGLQAWFESKGWDGSEEYNRDHFVQVVDSNLNGYKTDRVMKRAMHHEIAQDEKGNIQGELQLIYTHTQKDRDYRTREYRSYTRVRLPKDARDVRVDGIDVHNQFGETGFDVFPMDEYTEVGFFFTVPMNDQKTIMIEYTMPDPKQTFSVRYVKQPGVDAITLTARYTFDTNIVRVDEQVGDINGTQFLFNGDITKDTEFSLMFE